MRSKHAKRDWTCPHDLTILNFGVNAHAYRRHTVEEEEEEM